MNDNAATVLQLCHGLHLSALELSRIEDGVRRLRELAARSDPGVTVAQHAAEYLRRQTEGTRRTYRAPMLRLVFGAEFVGRRGSKGSYDLEEARRALDDGSEFAFPEGALGPRPVSSVTVADISGLITEIRRLATNRTSTSPVEHFIRATRAFFEDARLRGLCYENPARSIPIPRRPGPRRRSLTDAQLFQIRTVVRTYHHDPDLALLLVDIREETAARRSGIIGLNLGDIDASTGTIRLVEKGQAREQPASNELLIRVLELARARGSVLLDDPAFVQRRTGVRVTDRVYDGVFVLVDKHLPWARTRNIASHSFRHTTIKTVGRAYGEDVARAYAGHNEPGTVTQIYTGADPEEVADAHAVIFLEHTDLATRHGRFRPQRRPMQQPSA